MHLKISKEKHGRRSKNSTIVKSGNNFALISLKICKDLKILLKMSLSVLKKWSIYLTTRSNRAPTVSFLQTNQSRCAWFGETMDDKSWTPLFLHP